MSIYAEMKKHLYKWFLKQREQHSHINGDMFKETTKTLNFKFYRKSFQASNSWLQNFKKHYGIRFLKIARENLSSQPELIAPCKQKLSEKIAKLQLGLEQIFNANESGLYWKLLPDKTYVSSMEKTAPGRKTEKQRITFLACANASGNHKVKDFLETQGLPIRALLLLDNAPSHPPAEELNKMDKCVTVMYMPPNVTQLIQPMDQNAIRLTKLFYRKNLLSQVVAKGDVGETLKAVTLRDAVSNLNLAWDKLKPIVIKKRWHKILRQNFHFEKEEEENIPLSVLKLRIRDEDPEYAQSEIMKILNVLDPSACDQNDVAV
ncbi:jerky protein homolog-like [Euwallacea fornicatus]|uniref:jerky protein homolog-like n=1 Tax=Euwallacea fornicatus TaxID=995702 RepID=UPI00338D85BD